MFDLCKAKRRLKWLRLTNLITWFLTLALFIYPVYQWWFSGSIPFNQTFICLTFINIVLVIVAAKLISRIRFAKYQIRYFTNNEDL